MAVCYTSVVKNIEHLLCTVCNHVEAGCHVHEVQFQRRKEINLMKGRRFVMLLSNLLVVSALVSSIFTAPVALATHCDYCWEVVPSPNPAAGSTH